MDNAGYTSLTRQSGLMREMQMIAHNIANASTGGFRSKGMVFSEFVKKLDGGAPSLSMASGNAHFTSDLQGGMEQTGGSFDFAIEGPGYFLVETPDGEALTRAGNFTPSAEGELVTPDGLRVLDAGGAPIFIPPDATGLAVASDGTVSADGRPLARIGVWQPSDPNDLSRREGVLFDVTAPPIPVENGVILQGFLEKSNVDPIYQIARMIQVQRAYELGQSFLEKEDGRIRNVLSTLSR
ncbi:flagellar hook-basal body complex protein [Maribius pontilimi]|uniref:Flagellar basal-body rod protein FlgF n=1 Tax=Palleronia pontilimi TaxID=1964209 RepID=A0A934I9Z7_9RHOB|nr:flagellar hook-basal body complex protein [Palleronia pontilimi]MBJ3763178.1 flagellar hook-basal body complex protein [Palleronia pontilimi]